jgi:hypothetical protein
MGGGLPLGFHWGVDSAGPADFLLKGKRLFDHVVSELGTVPEFWGRYLFDVPAKDKNGKPIPGLFDAKGVTKQEADFIANKSAGKCRILLVANFGASQLAPPKGTLPTAVTAQGRAMGQQNATTAINRAARLGVPGGVFIYIDVEPGVQCNAGWFLGWFDAMLKAGRGRGGVYEVARDPKFFKPYLAALKANVDIVDIFQKALTPDPPFLPDPPPFARLLWAQRPLAIPTPSNQGVDSPGVKPASSIPFKPDEPAFCPGMTVLWQYALKFLVLPGITNSQIDMNMAKTQGLLSMWKP